MSYKTSIEEKANLYAERVCSGNFPIEYSREQVVKHTTNDFMAGFKCANSIGFSRFLYYGTWQTIGDNGEDMLYKSYKTGEEKFASELYNLFLDNPVEK